MRRRDVDRQREALSAATWSVLAEGGLSRLTLRAVAERAGCTTGLVLHTFRDRRALLIHARQRLRERASTRVDQVEAAASSPQEALREVLFHVLAVGSDWSDEPRVWLSFLAAALDDADLARHHVEGNRALLARVSRLLAALHEDWPDARLRTTASALVALVEGFNVLASVDPETYSRQIQRAAVAAALEAVDVPP